MIIGLAGVCRKAEFTFLNIETVAELRVNIPNRKTIVTREFAIRNGVIDGLNLVEIIKKYIKLRPASVKHNRFFFFG